NVVLVAVTAKPDNVDMSHEPVPRGQSITESVFGTPQRLGLCYLCETIANAAVEGAKTKRPQRTRQQQHIGHSGKAEKEVVIMSTSPARIHSWTYPAAVAGAHSGLRSGDDYRQSLRDGRKVWLNGEQIKDVTTHPAFRPIVDVRARMYDLAREEATADR